jgi:hypothetical protein
VGTEGCNCEPWEKRSTLTRKSACPPPRLTSINDSRSQQRHGTGQRVYYTVGNQALSNAPHPTPIRSTLFAC